MNLYISAPILGFCQFNSFEMFFLLLFAYIYTGVLGSFRRVGDAGDFSIEFSVSVKDWICVSIHIFGRCINGQCKKKRTKYPCRHDFAINLND